MPQSPALLSGATLLTGYAARTLWIASHRWRGLSSRLLTLEGEKQQKILASSCHPNEILAANRSVRHTIVQITYLEQILYELLAEMETSLDEDGGAAPLIH